MPGVLSTDAMGRRVVIRTHRAGSVGGPRYTDVVGTLIGLDEAVATLDTRRGQVVVALADIALARTVAPSRAAVLTLERLAADGWVPAEVLEYDGWLLRANEGWTARANSVLPLATPTTALGRMLETAAVFYADRGLPLRIQVPLPARGLLDAELAGRCWQAETEVVVMTRDLDQVPTGPHGAAGPDGQGDRSGEIRVEDHVTDRWRAGYHVRDGVLPPAAVALLNRHPLVGLVSLADAAATLAIARGTVQEGWLMVTAVEVDAAARRHGVGTEVMAAVERWGRTHGAGHAQLQVSADNAGAVQFYRRLGYREHHRYHYRVPKDGGLACT